MGVEPDRRHQFCRSVSLGETPEVGKAVHARESSRGSRQSWLSILSVHQDPFIVRDVPVPPRAEVYETCINRSYIYLHSFFI